MRKGRFVLGGTALALAVFGGAAWWNASRAWTEASARTMAEGRIRFEERAVEMRLPAGLESLGTPRVFSDAAEFGGRLYVSGPSGLLAFEADGTIAARYRPGLELPPAPLTKLAVGRAGAGPETELWIATAGEGLLSFDGRRFRQIRPEAVAFRKLTSLLPLATGQILMGTEKEGVLAFDGTAITPFHETLTGVPVTALAGNETALWVGTLDRGVMHWRAGQMQSASEAEGLPDRQIHALYAVDGRAWAGTSMGVAELEGASLKRVLAPGFFSQAVMKRGGNLLVGTIEEGWVETPLEGRLSKQSARGCSGCSVVRFLELDGKLVTVTRDSVLVNGEEWAGAERSLLADRDVSALAVDAGGKLWVGYFDRGLEILPASGGITRRYEDDVLFCVNRIVHDGDRTLVATANGLAIFDGNGSRRNVLRRADGLIASHVTDAVVLEDGTIAAATPAGVSLVQTGGITSLYAFHGLVNNHAYAVAADSGSLLVGTLGGLSMVRNGMVNASFTTANSGLKHNWISALVKASADWFVGTYGAGVLRFDQFGQWSAFPDLPKFEVNPTAMKATSCCVYAGTLGRGLAVYRREAGRWSFHSAGLPSLNVTAVEERGGVLYVGTDNGAVRVPEASLLP